jgi:hypothetical protein
MDKASTGEPAEGEKTIQLSERTDDKCESGRAAAEDADQGADSYMTCALGERDRGKEREMFVQGFMGHIQLRTGEMLENCSTKCHSQSNTWTMIFQFF